MSDETKGAPSVTATDGRASRAASRRGERIAKIGTILSAIMASSCCWVPLLLALLAVFGVSTAGMSQTIRASLETYRPIFMVVTFGFLGFAFYFTYRPRGAGSAEGGAANCWPTTGKSGGRRFNMMTMNKVMLWVVAAMAVVFLFFPQQLVGVLLPNEKQELTAEMTRTVLRVEGMTWVSCEAHAEKAIAKAPGVLAVVADYSSGRATIGTEPGKPIPQAEILASLKSIGYSGEFVEQ